MEEPHSYTERTFESVTGQEEQSVVVNAVAVGDEY